MTRFIPDIVNNIAVKTGYSKKDIKTILDYMREEIIEMLCNNDDVNLKELGTFKLKQRNERIGENPLSKEKLVVPAHRTVTFFTVKTLRDKVR